MYKSPSAEWNGKKLLRVRIKALGQGETANSRKIDQKWQDWWLGDELRSSWKSPDER